MHLFRSSMLLKAQVDVSLEVIIQIICIVYGITLLIRCTPLKVRLSERNIHFCCQKHDVPRCVGKQNCVCCLRATAAQLSGNKEHFLWLLRIGSPSAIPLMKIHVLQKWSRPPKKKLRSHVPMTMSIT